MRRILNNRNTRLFVLAFVALGTFAILANTNSSLISTPAAVLAAAGQTGNAAPRAAQPAAAPAPAQPVRKATPADTEKTSAGDLKITPINHASFMLEFGGKVIQVDPVGDYSALPKADLVLITDIHGDHMQPSSVAQVKKAGTIVVAPAAVQKTVTEAKVMANGASETLNVGGTSIKIETVPMYNLVRGPAAGQLYHDKGRGDGYILTLGGKRVYIAGDTECIPEMKALKNIDIAFIPMNLPYTMTPPEAAECAKAFQPKVIYPYHYMGTDPKLFADALKGEKGIEVRLRNWY